MNRPCAQLRSPGAACAAVLAAAMVAAHGASAEEPPRNATIAGVAAPRAELVPERLTLDPRDAEIGAAVGMAFRPLALTKHAQLAVSAGYLHELAGDDGVWARLGLAARFGALRIEAATIAERMLTPLRDELDVMATARADVALLPGVYAGAECIVPDLEDAWEADERDGGSKPFAGPTIAFQPMSRLRVSAGPSFAVVHNGPRVVERVSVSMSF